jgi:predicted double-glycine peptidase
MSTITTNNPQKNQPNIYITENNNNTHHFTNETIANKNRILSNTHKTTEPQYTKFFPKNQQKIHPHTKHIHTKPRTQ